MTKWIALASVIALAACSEAEAPEAAPETATEEVVAEAPASTTPPPGNYVAVYEDGTEQTFTMNADGTWSGVNLQGSPANGTYAEVDGKTCFTTEGGSNEDSCWTNQPPAADGTWSSTNDAGVKVTVRPAAS